MISAFLVIGLGLFIFVALMFTFALCRSAAKPHPNSMNWDQETKEFEEALWRNNLEKSNGRKVV